MIGTRLIGGRGYSPASRRRPASGTRGRQARADLPTVKSAGNGESAALHPAAREAVPGRQGSLDI
jgi:hypothetical protein